MAIKVNHSIIQDTKYQSPLLTDRPNCAGAQCRYHSVQTGKGSDSGERERGGESKPRESDKFMLGKQVEIWGSSGEKKNPDLTGSMNKSLSELQKLSHDSVISSS